MKQYEEEYLKKTCKNAYDTLKEAEVFHGLNSKEANIAYGMWYAYRKICADFGID